MDQKKITRRVAVGAAVGGLAAAPFIFRSLRSKYKVNLPSDPTRTAPVVLNGTVTTTVEGVKVGPIKIPSMEIRSPEDRKRYNKLRGDTVRKAIDSDPRVARAREEAREERVKKALKEAWKNHQQERAESFRAERMQALAEMANKELEKVATSSLGEQERKQKEEEIRDAVAAGEKWLEKRVEEMKNRPQPPRQEVVLTEDQRRKQRERVVKSVEASVRKLLEKQYEGKQTSAEELEQIIEERTQEAIRVALERLESFHSTEQSHD